MDQVGNKNLAFKGESAPVERAFLGNSISFLDLVTSKNVS